MKYLSLLTSAGPVSVAVRYLFAIVGSMLTILGIFGVLTPEQIADITAKMRAVSAELPVLLAAVGGLMAIITAAYATKTKSSSDKAAEVAKKVDENIPAAAKVEIVTPGDAPNIIVRPQNGKG